MTKQQIVTTLILIAAGSVGAAASHKPTVEELHIGQGNTANAELTIIRCRDVARVIIDFLF